MSPTRRELVRATRARIVEAAGRLTRERGPNGFSMDVLAKEAGVARATVYEHFRSKRAVLDELATSTGAYGRHRRVAHEPQRPARRTARHPRRRLPALGRTRRRHPRAAHAHGDHGQRARERRRRRKVTPWLVAALAEAGQMRGHWSVDDAVDALGALTSYPTYERLRRGPRTPEQVEAVLAKLAVAIVSPTATPS